MIFQSWTYIVKEKQNRLRSLTQEQKTLTITYDHLYKNKNHVPIQQTTKQKKVFITLM